ncbi:MAG TPA: YggS family pyridoxal phosphate-dependent enzyme [Bacteroidales bacterium]|nr:YggS family pyridoxal phosphate-dependent enzyme [Bacteroidales bacterium]
MTKIAANINLIRSQIPDHVKLVAVSKTKSVEDILEAYNSGQRLFGENRVQEIIRKKDQLPSDIEWHMIGHLQSNKVKSIVSFISMIQSVDSLNLLAVINSEAAKVQRIVDCLLEVHIASEETKSGFSPAELEATLDYLEAGELKNIRICGLMGMATFTDDTGQVRKEFRHLRETFLWIKEKYFSNDLLFREISMGMSGDYHIAIEEGSTMIRVGSLIFGERNTNKNQNG